MNDNFNDANAYATGYEAGYATDYDDYAAYADYGGHPAGVQYGYGPGFAQPTPAAHDQRAPRASHVRSRERRLPIGIKPWRPLPDCSFTEAIQRLFYGYFTFDGRSSPREFWYGTLFELLVGIALRAMKFQSRFSSQTIPFHDIISMAAWVWSIGMFLPVLAIGFRRSHDSGHGAAQIVIITIVNFIAGMLFNVAMAVVLTGAITGLADIYSTRHAVSYATLTGQTLLLISLGMQIVAAVWTIWLMTRPSNPTATQWDRDR